MFTSSLKNWKPWNSHIGTGQDFYSAHAMGYDPYVVGSIVYRKDQHIERCIGTTTIILFHASRRDWEVLEGKKPGCGIVAPTQVLYVVNRFPFCHVVSFLVHNRVRLHA